MSFSLMEQKILIYRTLLIIFILYNSSIFAQEIILGKAKIVDGDTIHIKNNKIRLYGIDAPEKNQICIKNNLEWSCGIKATLAINNIINNKEVMCKILDIDQYKRYIAECFVNNININKQMIREGWALAYRFYSKKYVKDEIYAKKNMNGIWKSKFQNPWDFRKNN